MSITDRWHLARPPAGAKKCGTHRKVPSANHEQGMQWQVRGTDDQGERVNRNFAYEEQAKDFDAQLRASVKAGTYVDDNAGKVTFREYAEEWRRTRRKQGHATAERVERALRIHAYPVLGKVPMRTLGRRTSIVQEWIGGLDLHPNSARLLIGRVSAIFNAAVADRIMVANPLKSGSVEIPDGVETEVTVWSAEQVEAVARAMPGPMEAMVWLGGVTGMRQGELFGLALGDVNWPRKTVRVDTQVVQLSGGLAFGPVKNRKPRTVPIAGPVVPLLSEHVKLFKPVEVTLPWSDKKDPRRDGKPVTRTLLFSDHLGRAHYRQSANRPWRKAWESAGIPDMGRRNGMHVLRHTAASQWLSKGLNVAKVAAYLGDTVAVVWKTYAHWMPEDDDLGRAIMDGFLNPSRATDCNDTALSDG